MIVTTTFQNKFSIFRYFALDGTSLFFDSSGIVISLSTTFCNLGYMRGFLHIIS